MRVDRLRQNYGIQVVHKFFPLHPNTADEGMTLEQLFAGRGIDIAASQARMVRLMAQEGLPYGERSTTYNSRLAQELGKWAETQPGGENIHDRLYQAYFVDNVNLAQIENLLPIAAACGLPVAEAREVLEQRTFQTQVDEDWSRARSLGITGVPTFVMGHRGISGAQPYETLAAFVESAGAK